MIRKKLLSLLIIIVIVGSLHATDKTRPLNIIFFGNSFTLGSGDNQVKKVIGGIPGLVTRMAEGMGIPAPNVERALKGGKSLEFHMKEHSILIDKPADQVFNKYEKPIQWDVMVLQEYSTRPLSIPKVGRFDLTLRYAEELVAKGKSLNSNMRTILYQTWARHESLPKYYPNMFKTPNDFQNDLIHHYSLLRNHLNKVFRDQSCDIAPCGLLWQKLNFSKHLYSKDRYHASAHGSLINAMMIFKRIYHANLTAEATLPVAKFANVPKENALEYLKLVNDMK
ncbi:MAG: hypothetical protein HQL32_02005 [Planctomycetes bacterium]|nr:hypothetical protein [Planctomycetota bacterium]